MGEETPLDPESLPTFKASRGKQSAATLLMAAQSYRAAVTLMSRQRVSGEPQNGGLSIALYLLIGFAVELSLKAQLQARGWTPTKLMGLSHHLPACLDACEAAGVLHNSDVASLVRAAADMHQHHGARYLPDVDHLPVYDLITAAKVLDDHVMDVTIDLHRLGHAKLPESEAAEYLAETWPPTSRAI